MVKTTITNTGGETARNIGFRTAVPIRFAKGPRAIRISELARGDSVVRHLRIKVCRTATKGRKLVVRVSPTLASKKMEPVRKTVRIR